MGPPTLPLEAGPREDEVVREFQRRRRVTWERSRFAIVLALTAFVTFLWYVVNDIGAAADAPPPLPGFAAFGVFAGCLAWLAFIVHSNLRCPACGRVPTRPAVEFRAVDPNPRTCPSCGVRLR